MAIIGIDLGTTNSLVSYWTEEGAKIIPNVLGNVLTPSVVSVDEHSDEIFVGEIAKERLITHPQLTVAAFKRFMGTKRKVQLGKYEFIPEELASFIIRSLANDAENFLGEKVEEAVISVPAYFNDTQRKATKRAGELAGLKVERIINEPTAAALAYGVQNRTAETRFVVFDLGGGTFDVSILELFEGVMEVKAIAGDNYLGGEDFTALIYKKFLKDNRINEAEIDQKLKSNLWKQAEAGKRKLCNGEAVTTINCVYKDEALTWEISLKEFAMLAKPLIQKLRLPIETAMKDASLSLDDIDHVLLVGGATRMPMIKDFISKLFRKAPVTDVDPDQAIAIGAGIQAGMKMRNSVIKEVVLTDVCPYTFGIKVAEKERDSYLRGDYSPIIERNTTVPVSRVKRFFASELQFFINIEIYQGENRHVINNVKLGELTVSLPYEFGVRQAIDVRFTYDINGLLEVEATVVGSGAVERIVIEENPGSMSKIEIEKRLKALEAIKIHPRDKAENRFLIAKGERLYEETLGHDRERIARELLRFEAALKTYDRRKIKEAREMLEDLFKQIETGLDF
ncbi:MAG TPA: molecular chaperone HscC [Bacillota bacterium]|jgi:molecular chaperone HscC|nr:molecular chaperone HscC [Bacillota bacterium]HOL10786.1 molecular chaperone HscC [Bacillota bacterium]HPO98242.1 molecular chaperone HscC [Bacillota bacterium]